MSFWSKSAVEKNLMIAVRAGKFFPTCHSARTYVEIATFPDSESYTIAYSALGRLR
jgi:hypothetical protein